MPIDSLILDPRGILSDSIGAEHALVRPDRSRPPFSSRPSSTSFRCWRLRWSGQMQKSKYSSARAAASLSGTEAVSAMPKRRKIAHEQCFGRGAVGIEPAVLILAITRPGFFRACPGDRVIAIKCKWISRPGRGGRRCADHGLRRCRHASLLSARRRLANCLDRSCRHKRRAHPSDAPRHQPRRPRPPRAEHAPTRSCLVAAACR
jgi:hypothetical protein